MPKPIAPIHKRSDNKWWIDTSELHGFDHNGQPEAYGPYDTRDEAQEDREPVVAKVQARRLLGIKQYDPACAVSAGELKLAVKLLGKMTRGSMRLSRLDVDQRKMLVLLLYKWKGPGSLGESTLADPDTLKRLFYFEFGIDPTWPDAEDDFVARAISFAKDKPEPVPPKPEPADKKSKKPKTKTLF